MLTLNAWLLASALTLGQGPAVGPDGPPMLQVGAEQAQGPQGPRPLTPQGGQQGQGGRGGRANLPNPGPNAGIQEMQEYFDAFALVQAQRVLQLSEEDYGRFFQRMSRVYQLRRQHGFQRSRILGEIRRMYGNQAPESALLDTVKRLEDLDTKFNTEMRTARAGVDEVLSARQRAALLFFEEDMERQKIDFLIRSRQGGG